MDASGKVGVVRVASLALFFYPVFNSSAQVENLEIQRRNLHCEFWFPYFLNPAINTNPGTAPCVHRHPEDSRDAGSHAAHWHRFYIRTPCRTALMLPPILQRIQVEQWYPTNRAGSEPVSVCSLLL